MVSGTVVRNQGLERNDNGAATRRHDATTRMHEVEELAHRNLFLRLFQGSAVEANEATSLQESISTVLSYLCTELGWPVGHAYLADTDGILTSSSIWHLDHPERYEQFCAAVGSMQVKSGTGLVGRVVASGKPVWISDVMLDQTYSAGDVSIDPPLATGFAFPIIADGEIVAVLELFTHERLPVEDELLTLMEQVGLQVGLVAERFRVRGVLEAFAAELERSNRELEEFASIASHDLQEPLRKIQAFGDRLQANHGHLLPEDGQMYLSRMNDSAARLQVLINDLLTYSRVTVTAKAFALVDLTEVIAHVTSELGDQIHRTSGRIELGPLPTVLADKQQMHQLFQNLLSNAFKFHRPGVPPVVHISAVASHAIRTAPGTTSQEASWCITVADNGIGFKDRHSTRIFQMFERLHGRGVYAGTGIGLAICRKIVERHRGAITATGTPNEGSVFTITLPQR